MHQGFERFDVVQTIFQTIIWLKLKEAKLWYKRTIQNLNGERRIWFSSHSVQVFHGFVFYCIAELVHFSSHAAEFTFHSGWIFFWCHCSSVNLADRLHFIIFSFNSSRLFFFILIFGSPLLFLILGFKYSSQFFILASQLYYIGYCRCLVATRPPIAATLAHLSFYLSARVWYGMEVCRTSGVWLEYESILRKLPRVSEIATNHWIFLRCD